MKLKYPSLELNWLPNSLRKTLPTPTIVVTSGKPYGGCFSIENGKPVIEIADDDFESTLAHEWRHLYQKYNGGMGRSFYRPEAFLSPNTYKQAILEYFLTQPWEMDALIFQRRMTPKTELTEMWWEWIDTNK